jgi:hypothetical protein
MSLAKVSSFVLIAAAFIFGHRSSAQQQPSTYTPGGTVTGHVICSDTRRPARFAGVTLFGVPKDVAPAPKLDSNPDPAQIAAFMKTTMGTVNLIQAQTNMDGVFTLNNVAPGDYYVFATVAGYVQPVNIVQAAFEAGADLTKAIPGVPIVHVGAERTSEVDVTVERGAAISGKILWDDGAPVSGATVTTVSTKAKEDKLPPQFSMLAMGVSLGGGGQFSTSDDLGRFRIAGLAPGDYLVKVWLQTNWHFAMQGGVTKPDGTGVSTPPDDLCSCDRS